jgi:hypothetical protein
MRTDWRKELFTICVWHMPKYGKQEANIPQVSHQSINESNHAAWLQAAAEKMLLSPHLS